MLFFLSCKIGVKIDEEEVSEDSVEQLEDSIEEGVEEDEGEASTD
jgi:hypothetical protein